MADNRHKYGFRFYASMTGVGRTSGLEFPIASAYPPVINTNVSVGLSIGDPVEILTDGSIALSGDTTTSGAVPFGVIVGFTNVKVDSNQKSRPASYYPSGTTYATKANETRAVVLPFGRDLWEIDVDDAVTATTEAAYRALIGHNADMSYTLDASNPDRRRANPMLDISTGTDGATRHFRIFDISRTRENVDFSGQFVKLLVQLNEGREPVFTATGLA